MNTRIITIDGPAGAGKTTVSKLLSQKLACVYVDTGALYRGAAFEILQQKIDWENDDILDGFLKKLDLNFVMTENRLVLMSSGQDITDHIRTPEISMLASATSANPRVRSTLLGIQKNIARSKDAVFEGRDMGTVVFPNADHKFFLYADLNIRAKRRFDEMKEETKDLSCVQKEIETRDKNDSKRITAPLKAAEDAIKIDSTFLTVEEVVETMMKYIEKARQA